MPRRAVSIVPTGKSTDSTLRKPILVANAAGTYVTAQGDERQTRFTSGRVAANLRSFLAGDAMQRLPEPDVVVRPATRADLGAIEGLLRDAKLPLQGISEHLPGFFVAQEEGRVIAAVGCERYDAYGLLRSAVVDPEFRGRGLGHRLTERIVATGRQEGLRAIYLLTTTAEGYFPRFGFRRIARSDVPIEVQQSIEFRGACPESAVAMVLEVSSPPPSPPAFVASPV